MPWGMTSRTATAPAAAHRTPMLQRRNRPRNPPQRKLRPLMRPQIPAPADREIPPTGHLKTAIVPPKHNAGKTKEQEINKSARTCNDSRYVRFLFIMCLNGKDIRC